MPIIDNPRLQTICKIGQGAECCRYIMANQAGMVCGKHTDFKGVIDKRVADGHYVAVSDNCEGLR